MVIDAAIIIVFNVTTTILISQWGYDLYVYYNIICYLLLATNWISPITITQIKVIIMIVAFKMFLIVTLIIRIKTELAAARLYNVQMSLEDS